MPAETRKAVIFELPPSASAEAHRTASALCACKGFGAEGSIQIELHISGYDVEIPIDADGSIMGVYIEHRAASTPGRQKTPHA